MTTMSGPLAAEVAKPAFRAFIAVQILLPAASIRLLDGPGVAAFDVGDGLGSQTFTGRDAVFGTLGGASDIEDGIGNEAASLTLTMLPKTNSAMAALASPAAQGSSVKIWFGAIASTTGLVVGDPLLIFDGLTDIAEQIVTQNGRALQITVDSIMVRFLDADQGARMNNGFHQRVYPGEKGFEFVTSIVRKVPWGSDVPKDAITYQPAAAVNARYSTFYGLAR